MNEKQTSAARTIRPTKKQRELLSYIQLFITEHGYSPSYREIMVALGYHSVATVALHVGNLIQRGHLRKRDRSARSLEVVAGSFEQPLGTPKIPTNQVAAAEEKWLVEKVDYAFLLVEQGSAATKTSFDHLFVLIEALKVLGLPAAAQSFGPRLSALRQRSPEAP